MHSLAFLKNLKCPAIAAPAVFATPAVPRGDGAPRQREGRRVARRGIAVPDGGGEERAGVLVLTDLWVLLQVQRRRGDGSACKRGRVDP